MSLRAAADTLLTLLLAPPCAVCGRVLTHPLAGAVCDACWCAIAPHGAPFFLQGISRARAIGVYESTLRDVIHALKYDRRRSIAVRLSHFMADHGADLLHDADLAVPVPLHPARLRLRGFNQADDLARGLGVPVARVLARIRATTPQIDLPAEQRRDNVRDAFALRGGVLRTSRFGEARTRRAVCGCVVVLVDDVATTGATLESCARVLTAAGAKEVRALTAARVVSAPRQTPRA